MLQNNNFSQYNYNHQNNNMLQNNNFLQNNNNSQNNNFPQRINIPQNNFPQSNNIPQNLKYSQNINMPQNNFSQSNNIQQNYNFPQNNFPQSNNIQRNYNFPQDNNHKGFNTRIFEKFNDLENEIKKINTNLGIVKNENGINHLNTQNSTIGITNAMKINIYINGNFKFTKFLEKDLLLEKIREEIYNEIKSDFLFLLPDGFIINKEEEKLFSLEVILNENKLYINTEDIIIKINENKNKQSSKTTNANNEQTNGSENFTKNNENKNKDNNADNDNENNNNNKNQFIFKKRNKIEKNGKNDENDKGSLNKLIQSCQKLDNIGDLEIYLYPKINFTSKEKKNSIILMVVGQTGSGKTTLLNAFLNFLLGVEYEDNFRFKLIHEDFGISMAESQTKDVTVYNIRPLNKDFPLITVIDTPGFGDTGGIEKDKLIADKIAEKFHSEISHINAICFVAQSTNSKLTINQKYIFNSIMDLFSDEIKENFIAMLTFCNIIDENPVILEPLKKKGSGFDLVLPAIENTQWYFLFDNLAVFKSKENKKLNNKIKSFYGFAMENFHEFMAKLQSLKKKRLYNTKKVLNDRKFLESRVQILEEIVKTCLNKIDEFMQTYDVVRNCYNELQNKNFIYTVTETKSRKVPISNYKGGGGPYFTTCLICSHTCHPGCYIDSNDKKKECSAMDLLTGKCKVCKKNCDWSSHENRDFFWEEYQEKVEKTDEFLKEKYVKKESEKSAKEQILEGLEIDISKQNFDLINTQEEMKDTINELKKIALNKDVFESAEQHIDLLIENEKFEQKPGWQKRIEAFNILKRQKIKLKQIYHGKHTDANKIQDFVKTFNKKELQKNSGGKCSIF
jgi:energy-coupling factor transporter ATP-binding protein EcfA2